MELGTSRRS